MQEYIDNKNEILPKRIKQVIEESIFIVNNTTNDWVTIKKLIIKQIRPKDRSLFSRRHESTRKQLINDFEKEIIKYWFYRTGVELWINPDKFHPENWIWRPVGWKIREINEERAKKRSIANLNKKNNL